jgi:hypothetical protein
MLMQRFNSDSNRQSASAFSQSGVILSRKSAMKAHPSGYWNRIPGFAIPREARDLGFACSSQEPARLSADCSTLCKCQLPIAVTADR